MVRRAAQQFAMMIAFLAATATQGRAEIVCDVSFQDPAKQFAEYHEPLRRCIRAAVREWGMMLDGSARLSVEVSFPRGVTTTVKGSSRTQTPVRTIGRYTVFEQGALTKIRRDDMHKSADPDCELQIDPQFLRKQLWLDPDPERRIAVVPEDKVDGVSTFLHEFGHVFAFNSYLYDPNPEAREALSTFDMHVSRMLTEKPASSGKVSATRDSSRELFFIGPRATRMYDGRPIPLDRQWVCHVGNPPPGPGTELSGELMSGVAMAYGQRYRITPLTLAMLSDMDVPLRPEAQAILATGRGAVPVGVPVVTPGVQGAGGGGGAAAAQHASSGMSYMAMGFIFGGAALLTIMAGGIVWGIWARRGHASNIP